MTIRCFAFCLAALIGNMLALPLFAQNDDEMAAVFNWKFQMVAPDTGFIPMEEASGWEEPATDAKVICMAIPAPYERIAADLETLQSEAGQRILEKSTTTLGGVPGLLLLLEFSPVDGEETDLTYSLLFARPFENVSLLLSAQYPQSEDERLRAKILTAFATVRRINE